MKVPRFIRKNRETAMSTETKLYTTADLLSLPDDGVERWIIEGELFEGDREMTRRNRRHSRLVATVSHLIKEWLDSLPQPRGEVVAGEAGFRLSESPDTTVGIDVAYLSPELATTNADDAMMIEGAPTLAVEILSPSDVQKDIARKVAAYLKYGVQRVWIIDPDFQTVTVHSPEAAPVLYNTTQTIPEAPGMPGFHLAVMSLFS